MTVPIKRSYILIILSTILASFLASCAGKVESQTSTNTISPIVSEPLSEVKTALQNQPQLPPVKMVIITCLLYTSDAADED